MAYAAEENVRLVPRGAGTSLSGGALPLADAILLGLSRMTRILDIDYENRCVVVQPGVTNASVTRAVQANGFYYAPDPSSQIACTIGGNVAENSGGIHCLKYGLTTQNLMGVELVLMGGERIRLGGKHAGDGGLDLLSVVCGSEGLLGVVTEATLRILPRAPVTRTLLIAFDSVRAAGETVAAIIAPASFRRRSNSWTGAASMRWKRFAPELSAAPKRSCSRKSTACRPKSRTMRGALQRLRTDAARPKFAVAKTKQNARAHGSGARPRSAPWDGSSPTCCAWTERFRASVCRKCWSGFRRCRTITASCAAMSFTRATAICIR
jgi:FAD/FMN-containing dehydrogenase